MKISTPSLAEERTSKRQTWVKPYYPAFNSLRAIAITLVFLNHYVPMFMAVPRPNYGWVGVDLFFVLSGFLITGILYDSRHEQHFFRTFYIRRALRIFPLYYAVFAVIFILWFSSPRVGNRYFVSYALYFGNLIFPFCNLAHHNPSAVLFTWGHIRIDHFWSLCVEEQFYLLWPLVVWLLPSRKALMTACSFGIVAAFLLRSYLRYHAPTLAIQQLLLYESTYTRCDTLLAGGLLALWLRGTKLTRARFRQIAHLLTWVPLAALLLGEHLSKPEPEAFARQPFMVTIGYDLLALFFVGILMWAIDDHSPFAKLLHRSRLAGLGVVSYGFYVFHSLYLPAVVLYVLPLVRDHRWQRWSLVVLCFGFTWLLAWLSFHFFERHCIALKDRFGPASHPSVPSVRS